MGYMSTVILLHDAIDNIAKNPSSFTNSLVQTILSQGIRNPERPISFGIGNHLNPVALFHTAHADEHNFYVVGGNTAHRMPGSLHISSYIESDKLEEMALREMADKMGYRLVRKKALVK